jgi:hypothetical protein
LREAKRVAKRETLIRSLLIAVGLASLLALENGVAARALILGTLGGLATIVAANERLGLRRLLLVALLSIACGGIRALDLVEILLRLSGHGEVQHMESGVAGGRSRLRGQLRLGSRGRVHRSHLTHGERSGLARSVEHRGNTKGSLRSRAPRGVVSAMHARQALLLLAVGSVHESVGDLAESLRLKKARALASGSGWLRVAAVDVHLFLLLRSLLLLVVVAVARVRGEKAVGLSLALGQLGHEALTYVLPIGSGDRGVRGLERSHILLDVVVAIALVLAGEATAGPLLGDASALTMLLRAFSERSELHGFESLTLDFVTQAKSLDGSELVESGESEGGGGGLVGLNVSGHLERWRG